VECLFLWDYIIASPVIADTARLQANLNNGQIVLWHYIEVTKYFLLHLLKYCTNNVIQNAN